MGFEAAEAEVHAGAVGHRPWQREAVGVALFGKRRQFGAAGVRQSHQFGGFVEGFADGVVQRLPQQAVFARGVHRHQLGVAAGNEQGDKRHFGLRFGQ